METDIRRLYNLLIKISNKLDNNKNDQDVIPLIEKVLKNQKSMEDRLRKIENQSRKIEREIKKLG